MSDGITPNVGLIKPEVGASDDMWGEKLNYNFDLIDAALPGGGIPAPATALPLMDDVATVGITVKYAREDHVHPSDTSRATVTYVDAQDNLRVLKAGDTMTGNLTISKDIPKLILNKTGLSGPMIAGQNLGVDRWGIIPANGIAETATDGIGSNFSINRHHNDGSFWDSPLTIDRFTGRLSILSNPTLALEVAPKQYVDSQAAAAAIPPATVAPLMNGIAAVGTVLKYAKEDHIHPTDTSRAPTVHTHAQADVTNLVSDLALKAPLASPVFTGNPTAPTPTAGDNDTSIATTAFVTNAVTAGGGALPSNANPVMDGTAAPGVSALYSRGDHVHPSDTSRQPLDSDLTAIAALAPPDNDIIQRKSSAWTNRTPAQFKTDLSLTKADVGLGNVDNTSDANKPVSTAGAAADALRVLKAGDTMTGNLSISTTSATLITINGGNVSSGGAAVLFQKGSPGWNVGHSSATFGGTSDDFLIYNNAIGSALSISKATNNAIFGGNITVTGFNSFNSVSGQYGISMVLPVAQGAILFSVTGSGSVGNISCTTSSTSYNTSSDERLKEDLKSFDAGHIIDDTAVYDFAWKATGERAYGVIAQQAVTVYDTPVFHDEKEDHWYVDYSKYVPVLLQELKALRTRVAQLEAKAGA